MHDLSLDQINKIFERASARLDDDADATKELLRVADKYPGIVGMVLAVLKEGHRKIATGRKIDSVHMSMALTITMALEEAMRE